MSLLEVGSGGRAIRSTGNNLSWGDSGDASTHALEKPRISSIRDPNKIRSIGPFVGTRVPIDKDRVSAREIRLAIARVRAEAELNAHKNKENVMRQALAVVTTLCWFGVATLASMLITGCGPALIEAKDSIEMEIQQGPPCEVIVKADGKIVSTVKGPNKCPVEVE